MKSIHRLILSVASAAFFIASAHAQNSGTGANHAFMIGKGASVQGYTSLSCGANTVPIGQSSADPSCTTILAALQLWGLQIPNLTHKGTPAGTDKVMFYDAAGNATVYATLTEFIGSSNVLSFNSRTGNVTPAFGDYPITLGGTGVDNCYNEALGGLLPGKFIPSSVMFWNPGYACNQFGTKRLSSMDNTNSSTPNYNPLLTDYTTQTVDWTASPQPIGGMLSGALALASSAYNGTEVFNYLIRRLSDNKVAIIGSSSDSYSVNGYSATFTVNTGTDVITLSLVPALRLNATVTFTTTGTLPAGLSTGTRYFVCNTGVAPYTATLKVATSIPNVNTATCVDITTTGTGTHTMHWGVQNDIDFALGAGVAIVERPIPWFNFVWNSGWDYIPDFQLGQYSSVVTLTGFDQSVGVYCYNGLATQASFTRLAFAYALANINRRALFYAACHGGASGGTCSMASSAGTGSLPVGTAAASAVSYANSILLGTDSDTAVFYKMTGTATMDICIRGWENMDAR